MQNKIFKSGATALFLSLAGSTILAPAAHAQFGKISEQEEIEAGRQSMARAIKEYGRALPQNDPRARRVARIGGMFAAQSTRRNIPFSYTVLQNDKVLNAFAAPGGPIFVTTKLLATTANDAELAYVLGHETGHIERKHIVNQVAKQQKVGLGVGIVGAILGRGKNSQAASMVGGLVVAGFNSKYSRKDEDDADNYGVNVMARLGFDPRAAVSMLGKLGGGASGAASFLASHPSPQSRQAKVTTLIRDKNLLEVAQQSGGARLMMSGSDSSVYGSSGATYYPSNSNSNSYPDDESDNYGDNGADYGDNGADYGDNGADYGDNGAGYGDAPRNSGGTIRLGAPLRLVNSGQAQVVLAPVVALTRYAGGSARQDDQDTVTVSRGGDYLRMQVGSTRATLNGRAVRLSTAPRVLNGLLYAPLGSVVAGLGGEASVDENRNAVRIDFDGRGGYLPL